jgi:hypothetical protein
MRPSLAASASYAQFPSGKGGSPSARHGPEATPLNLPYHIKSLAKRVAQRQA